MININKINYFLLKKKILKKYKNNFYEKIDYHKYLKFINNDFIIKNKKYLILIFLNDQLIYIYKNINNNFCTIKIKKIIKYNFINIKQIYTINLYFKYKKDILIYFLKIYNNIYNYNKYIIKINNSCDINFLNNIIILNNKNSKLNLLLNNENLLIKNNIKLKYYKIINIYNKKTIYYSNNNFFIKNNNIVDIFNFYINNKYYIYDNNNFYINGNNNVLKKYDLILTKNNFNNINNFFYLYGKYNFIYYNQNNLITKYGKSLTEGLSFIKPKAKKNNVNLSFNSLLINNKSYFYCKPYLISQEKNIIDLKHKVKIENLNNFNDKFYFLYSRGIDKYFCKKILINSFLYIIINFINHSFIKKYLLNKIKLYEYIKHKK